MDPNELPWRKSSYSMGNGGNCVEVAEAAGSADGERRIHVRDSKDPDGPALRFGHRQWQAFVTALKSA
ncbi:DUF397 domain-containing protein [Streptomyces sp. 8N706]|uniref:DUF397 domain-containing protein n=1 Tax=Streptomyces sp. 8N706 TaxID=3457416 RepID=UPI003FD38FEB